MRIYRGCFSLDGDRRVVVAEQEPGQPEIRKGELTHHVLHSPDGFNWGYSGSGPTELARCILIDHLGNGGEKEMDAYPHVVRAFRESFLTPVPAGQPWVLRSVDIDAWLRAIGR